MPKDLIFVGSGGCMREFLWQLGNKTKWNIVGYVDKFENSTVRELKYLGDDDYLLSFQIPVNVAVCVGDSILRERIVTRLKQNNNLHFPPILAEGAKVAESAVLGEGVLIGMGCVISVDVVLKDFTFINTNVIVSHDCKIEEFVSLSPSVTLAGNVLIGEKSQIGMGSQIIQGITIGKECRIGAGAVVINNIPDGVTAVGVPAKRIN